MRVLIVLTLILVVTLPFSDARGGRGGGSRGGSSSRGSSSRSSSSSSSSHRSSTSNTWKSNYNPPVRPTAPKLPDIPSTRVRPSAPEMPSRPQPSAPKLPSPQQPAYNPNYRNLPGPTHGQPLPYPVNNAGSPMGPPPPYPGLGRPPPYPGPVQARPPPYDFNQGRSPAYPKGNLVIPLNGQRPYQAGRPYPQQPNVGNSPYPRQPQPYPQQPNVGNSPYPRQPQPYPQQPNFGNRPYPQQPRPYPQQPGINPSYGAPPTYTKYTGLPIGGNTYTKPYKKKGLLGQLFSGSKPSRHYGGVGGGHYGGVPKYGGHYGGSHGIPKAMYPIIPLMAMKKAKFKPKFSSPSFPRPIVFMPYHSHGHHYRSSSYYDIDDDDYGGQCRRPLTPGHAEMNCSATELGVECRTVCKPGYRFGDNTTEKENRCWHAGGVWQPTRNFRACEPICSEPCRNGGKCVQPDTCLCDPEYRGETCQHHILNCDINKLAGENRSKLSWSCQHNRNETVCKVRCRSSLILLEPQTAVEFRCKPDGEWITGTLPNCDESETKTRDVE